jgi:hypothetical protein
MTLTVRNLFLSLVLLLTLTFTATLLYILYPMLRLLAGTILTSLIPRGAHNDGIAAVAGGVSEAFLLIVVLAASALFLSIFFILQRRSGR